MSWESQQYLRRKKKVAEERNTGFTLIADGLKYEYGVSMAVRYIRWATLQRAKNIDPNFKNFYDQLPELERIKITVLKLAI